MWPGACAQPMRSLSGSSASAVPMMAAAPAARAAANKVRRFMALPPEVACLMASRFGGYSKGKSATSATPTTDRVPVLVLTAFLGTGKTTLLTALLRGPAPKDPAHIVNDSRHLPPP